MVHTMGNARAGGRPGGNFRLCLSCELDIDGQTTTTRGPTYIVPSTPDDLARVRARVKACSERQPDCGDYVAGDDEEYRLGVDDEHGGRRGTGASLSDEPVPVVNR